MAILSPASSLNGARGRVGDLIFRKDGNKTVVQTYSKPRGERSELQKRYNKKMQLASFAARAAMSNPAVKAHYEKKKKCLNVSSAYTAACTDFLRTGRIDYVDTSKCSKGQITIKAHKANLGLEQVTVKFTDAEGNTILQGIATAKSNGEYLFRFPNPPNLDQTTITVCVKDKMRNTTTAVLKPNTRVLTQENNWARNTAFTDVS